MKVMHKKYLLLVSVVAIFTLSVLVQANTTPVSTDRQVSGRIVNGLRILTVDPKDAQVNFTVYRGDYIKFKFDTSVINPILKIPELSVNQTLPNDLKESPYFKMKHTGTFAYTLDGVPGRISVIEYRQEHYREFSSQQAEELIATSQPIILDVRTPMEYKAGRLKDAILIPVQQLRERLNEISAFKDRDILVYCATGNRSTVASKILNDNGFTKIANMRFGIVQWAKDNKPMVR